MFLNLNLNKLKLDKLDLVVIVCKERLSVWCLLGSPTANQKLLSIASMTLSTQLWLGYGRIFSTLLQIVLECSG